MQAHLQALTTLKQIFFCPQYSLITITDLDGVPTSIFLAFSRKQGLYWLLRPITMASQECDVF